MELPNSCQNTDENEKVTFVFQDETYLSVSRAALNKFPDSSLFEIASHPDDADDIGAFYVDIEPGLTEILFMYLEDGEFFPELLSEESIYDLCNLFVFYLLSIPYFFRIVAEPIINKKLITILSDRNISSYSDSHFKNMPVDTINIIIEVTVTPSDDDMCVFLKTLLPVLFPRIAYMEVE
ncbi:hypothetical protein WA158_002842 [Blastocystis sp. Blastoise]